jgi:hypothetical protein
MDLQTKKSKKPLKDSEIQEIFLKFKKPRSLLLLTHDTTLKKKPFQSDLHESLKLPLKIKQNQQRLNFRYPRLSSFLLQRPCSDLVPHPKHNN